MSSKALVECTFLMPVRRDAQISNGERHYPEHWDWLQQQLVDRFSYLIRAPGLFQSIWKNSESGEQISARSRKLTVAVNLQELAKFREFLSKVCIVFHQKCLYLSVAGQVEFVEAAP